MKKILSTVAALGLVAGMATAAQALEFKVSGYYEVEGTYLSSADGSGVVTTTNNDTANSGISDNDVTDDDPSSDAYWNHEFVIKPVMKVNDKITMKSKIYLAKDMFGGDDLAVADGGNIKVHHLYMEYMSPIGKLRVGRTSAGLWQGAFLSTDSYANRIMYFPNFLPKPFGACVFIQKSAERDAAAGTDLNDADSDGYEVSGWYKTKDLVAALAFDRNRDAGINTPIAVGITNDTIKEHNRLKGYYNQNMGNMYAEMEFSYDWGTYTYSDLNSDDSIGPQNDTDIDTFALMADVGMTMDKLDVGMMLIYASGDDDSSDDDLESAMSATYKGHLGEQFQPYQILTGAHTGMLSSDWGSTNSDMAQAGLLSLGVHADFAVNDKLSLHSALAFAQATTDELTSAVGVEADDFDESYGWEVDLGVSYNLMDNLTYEANFGYLAAGDFFTGYTGVANITTDSEDVYVLNHRLTMEF